MSVMNSSVDVHAHDDHLRRLLDQRAARADLHGRFPSLSEFSDSPSVYSPHLSPPHPSERDLISSNTLAHFATPIRHHQRPTHSEQFSPITDRERLNIPHASSLDLDYEQSSAGHSHDHDDDDDESVASHQEEPEEARISAYGPKMRFHSRAPWELGEDDIPEQDEQETTQSSKRAKGKASKGERSDGTKRVWGLARSNEPRPNPESNRHQGRHKQSFESTTSFNSNGPSALLALAQASMSSTSLAITPPQSSLRDKLSIPRLRSRTTSHSAVVSPAELSPDTRFPSQYTPEHNFPMTRFTRAHSPVDSENLHADARTSSSGASSRSPTPQEYTHPYANPDLVRQISRNISAPPSPHLAPYIDNSSVNRSDSNATLTDSSMLHSRSTTTVSLTPGTSASSVRLGSSESIAAVKKGISPPMPVSKATIRSVTSPAAMSGMANTGLGGNHVGGPPESRLAANNIPGWSESPSSPSFKLITLEEAQARERTRSATANATIMNGISTPSLPQTPIYEQEQTQGPKSRTRTTSAGGRMKSAMQSMTDLTQPVPPLPIEGSQMNQYRSMDAVSAKAVVRKKSGFMRLFNAKETKEKERSMMTSPLPPVPAADSSAPAPQQWRSRQGLTPRVPVPSLTPSILGDAGSGGSSPSSGSPSDSLRVKELHARRNAPGLSILTTSPSTTTLSSSKKHLNTAPLSASSEFSHRSAITTMTAASMSSPSIEPVDSPQNGADFVALSLRPVSTMFSSKFGYRSAAEESRPSLDIDNGTPTSSATGISPFSPDFSRLATEGKGMSFDISRDDQSAVISALQDQIMSARRAWQQQIWELEGQVRDLKAEVDELRSVEVHKDYCVACGRGGSGQGNTEDPVQLEEPKKAGVKVGVVNRPRARTGVGSRFASAT